MVLINSQKVTEENREEEKASLQISNHNSWLDILIFINLTGAGFLFKKEVRYYPLIGLIDESIIGVFMNRGGQIKFRGSYVKNKKLAKANLFRKGLSKFMIFPEATTSNNTGILKFKKGVFVSEMTIKSFVIKLDSFNKVSFAMDVIEIFHHVLIVISVPFHFVVIIDLPVYTSDKGSYLKNLINVIVERNDLKFMLYLLRKLCVMLLV